MFIVSMLSLQTNRTFYISAENTLVCNVSAAAAFDKDYDAVLFLANFKALRPRLTSIFSGYVSVY